MAAIQSQRTKIFISYSHKDIKWLKRLKIHLKPIEREHKVVCWDDSMIKSGSRWPNEIRNAVNSAKIAILLISADFLASDFIAKNELPPLLAAAEKDVIILPIIVSPSRFEDIKDLCEFKAVNPPSKPLIKMSKSAQEDLFVKVADIIKNVLNDMKNSPASSNKVVRAYGNNKGCASGHCVYYDENEIEDIYRKTGEKVIFFTDEPHMGLPFDKIAGIVTTKRLGDTEHVNLYLQDLNIPVITLDYIPEPFKNAKVSIDSDNEGNVEKIITFSSDFIYKQHRDYLKAVKKNIRKKSNLPQALIDLVIGESTKCLSEEIILWSHTWGPVEEITSAVLPLLGREHFMELANICKQLCSEYQWPVGLQEARRVLPQLAYYCREETLSLLESWMHSKQLYLVKSVAMSLGNIVLMRFPIANDLVELILDHPNDTVVKEAARALPNIIEVNPALAERIVKRTSSLRSLLGVRDYRLVVENYRKEFNGISLSGIPGYLTLSTDLAFAKIESAVELIRTRRVMDNNLWMGVNYIFANILLLAEIDPGRLLTALELLRPYINIERHLQVELLVAAARLASTNKQISYEFLKLTQSNLDKTLGVFFGQVKDKLIS